MIVIDDNGNIALTRGDSARLHLNVCDIDGKEYEIKESDTIFFTVKKSVKEHQPIIQKTAIAGVIELTPDDTAALEYGYYIYDVELRQADGFTQTVVPPSRFKLTEEVTT